MMVHAKTWPAWTAIVLSVGCASRGPIAPPQALAQPGSGTTAVATEQRPPPLPELPVFQPENQPGPITPRRL